ncbi:hypothetical protein C8Q78DRAFT_843887 [Trametes maxima]|nr:hypothetical protein C8Q78DRAFT_843887 [Trametes maxima]
MSQPNPSASVFSLSVTEESTTSPSSSTVALVPKGTRPEASSTPATSPSPPKDYEKAFAALSSSYGFSGAVPTKNPKKKEKEDKKNKKNKGKKPATTTENPASPQPTTSSASGQNNLPDAPVK